MSNSETLFKCRLFDTLIFYVIFAVCKIYPFSDKLNFFCAIFLYTSLKILELNGVIIFSLKYVFCKFKFVKIHFASWHNSNLNMMYLFSFKSFKPWNSWIQIVFKSTFHFEESNHFQLTVGTSLSTFVFKLQSHSCGGVFCICSLVSFLFSWTFGSTIKVWNMYSEEEMEKKQSTSKSHIQKNVHLLSTCVSTTIDIFHSKALWEILHCGISFFEKADAFFFCFLSLRIVELSSSYPENKRILILFSIGL